MVQSNEMNITANESILRNINNDLADHLFLKNYVSFLQNHPDLILVFSRNGQLLTKNLDEIYRKLAINSKQNINFADIIPNEQFESIVTAFNNVKNGKIEKEHLNFNMFTKDNEQLYITATFIPIKSLQQQVIDISIIIKDLTEKIYLETALDQTNQDFKNIFDQIHSGTWIWDVKNEKVDFVSKGLAEILQLPLETLYKNDHFLEDVILPEYRKQFAAKNYLLEQGKTVDRTFQIITGQNKIKWIREQTIPTVDPTGKVTHYFGRIIDITQEVELKRKLEYLATHDEVTGLPNNYHLQEKLDAFIADQEIKQFAMFTIDLDNFQWIIHYLGYKMGDEVMKETADRFVAICPENGFISIENNDTFVFVLLNYNNEEEVISFVEKVMEHVAQKINLKGYEFYITASVGITFYPKHGTDKLILLENAHSALHYAKNIGKNNYQLFSSNRDIRSHKKYHLEKDLRKAIENEEFTLHFQPQVKTQTNEIVGAEALIRWHHKEWGLVSPGEFIEIAEKKHLIEEIGNWVIRNVCEHLNNWRNKGYKLIPISINISPIQLLKPRLIETIKTSLATYNISTEYLILEITEGTLLQTEDFINDRQGYPHFNRV